MIAEKMKSMVANSSAIRAMFEEGNRLAQVYGRENVFDFSLGNQKHFHVRKPVPNDFLPQTLQNLSTLVTCVPQ